jgi:hypothetical protein
MFRGRYRYNQDTGASATTARARLAAQGGAGRPRDPNRNTDMGVGSVIAAQLFCPCLPLPRAQPLPPVCDPFLDTKITFNVLIVGEGAVDICGYALTFTESGGSVVIGPPFIGVPTAVVATPDIGWIFTGWGGVLSGSANPTEYNFAPIECQNTSYNISATFVLSPP